MEGIRDARLPGRIQASDSIGNHNGGVARIRRTVNGIGGVAGDIGVAGNGGAVPLQIRRVEFSRPNGRVKGWCAQAFQRSGAGDGSNRNGRSSHERKDHG